MAIRIEGLDHVAIAVSDQTASAAFYRDLLGLERAHADAWGDTPVALMDAGGGMALFRAQPGAGRPAGFRHIAFRVDRANFEAAQEELRRRGIPFELQDHDVSHSIYFEDPDGVQLELTTYEVSAAARRRDDAAAAR